MDKIKITDDMSISFIGIENNDLIDTVLNGIRIKQLDANTIHLSLEWIDCKERLPPENQLVLVFWKNKYEEGYDLNMITNPKDGNLWGSIAKESVVSWMPLPKPPEVK